MPRGSDFLFLSLRAFTGVPKNRARGKEAGERVDTFPDDQLGAAKRTHAGCPCAGYEYMVGPSSDGKRRRRRCVPQQAINVERRGLKGIRAAIGTFLHSHEGCTPEHSAWCMTQALGCITYLLNYFIKTYMFYTHTHVLASEHLNR